MKLIDRHACEGTEPVIYIGHREYPKPHGRVHVSGTWYAEYCVAGRHRYEAVGTTNKQVAIREAHAICRRIAAGESRPKVYKLSIEQLKTAYLDTKVNEGRPDTTIGKYTYTLGLFCDWARKAGKTDAVCFGEREFWAFNKWLTDAGDSDSTRYDRLILVKQAFKWGHAQKLLPENPIYGIKLAEPEAQEQQPCFTAEQVGTLLSTADPHEAAIYAAMAYLGLRFGEARDLRWTDILWHAGKLGFVVIRRGGSGNRTKNKKVRRIPLHPMLKPYLTTISRKSERVFAARPSKKHPQGDGPIDECRQLRSLKRLCKRCGFEKPDQYKLHTFRHAFASMCARTNVAYKYALEWMGHHSSEILDLYYTMYDDVAETAIKTIEYSAPAKVTEKPSKETAA